MLKSMILILIFMNEYFASNLYKNNIYENSIQAKDNNCRTLLGNETLSESINSHFDNDKKGMSKYQKHIRIVILVVILVASITAIISTIFLILCLKKKCKNKKEEQEARESSNNDIPNFKNKKSIEMSDLSFKRGNYFRGSIPMKRNKTYSSNNLYTSINLGSNKNIGTNPINVQNINEEKEEESSKNKSI